MRAETRHQLKQDKFSKATISAAENTAHWAVEHQSKLIYGTVAVLVLAAAIVGGWYYFSVQDDKANLEFNQAMRTMDTPVRPAGTPAQPEVPSFASSKERSTEARKQFQAIVDKYPHTKTGEVARYFVGLIAANMGDNAAAETDLKQVVSGGNSDLAALGNLALASLYRNTGRNKDAIEIYKKLAEKPAGTVSKATAQLQLGETYIADQQPQEAKHIYEQIQKENPGAEAAQIANARLQDIK